MGVEVSVEGLTKSFGSQNIWRDVSLTLPSGEVSALLGPSGTGKSVFLKTLIGLLHPEQGSVVIDGTDITKCSAKELYEIRKLFGVLFQDGALFGSMSLYDNIAFPLREHTKKKEAEIRNIVMEKIDLVGLAGAEDKLPGEISGGMRKRAGLARALVLDPQIILCDEPDSGLDPVRTAYISQLLIDINAQIDATILIVTHNINIARTIPDNIGMLFRKELVMFGPREQLLTSEQPVVKQFLSGDRFGPIGMSEEKDESVAAAEAAMQAAGISGGGTKDDFTEIIAQVQPNPGMPERKAVARHRERVHEILHTLPPNAQEAIRRSMAEEDRLRAENRAHAETHVAANVGEWSTVGQGGVALADSRTADSKTDVIDFGGNDAPTQQWATPADVTQEISGDTPGHEGRTT
ncbi:ABC transporter ATP-binding protein [Gordonia sp. ABSL1-1]|uniref:ABC transporter ATP-binding protein n=1 Tax=Gordonia sp. ABSL1-1 TaxID=3053923 RepID=UPI0025736C36|nr:ABC transporter ATP-binding protein [Gordonia sp. ABSL1-1]MDL9936023.1 ABC transporter ATP-binding protein [Gordonia sp. ABSL1-1]